MRIKHVIVLDFDETTCFARDEVSRDKKFTIRKITDFDDDDQKRNYFWSRGIICASAHIPNISWFFITFAILQRNNIAIELGTQRLYMPNPLPLEACLEYLNKNFGVTRGFLRKDPEWPLEKLRSINSNSSNQSKVMLLKYYKEKYPLSKRDITLVDDNKGYSECTKEGYRFILANQNLDHLFLVLINLIGIEKTLMTLSSMMLIGNNVKMQDVLSFKEKFRKYAQAHNRNNLINLIETEEPRLSSKDRRLLIQQQQQQQQQLTSLRDFFIRLNSQSSNWYSMLHTNRKGKCISAAINYLNTCINNDIYPGDLKLKELFQSILRILPIVRSSNTAPENLSLNIIDMTKSAKRIFNPAITHRRYAFEEINGLNLNWIRNASNLNGRDKYKTLVKKISSFTHPNDSFELVKNFYTDKTRYYDLVYDAIGSRS